MIFNWKKRKIVEAKNEAQAQAFRKQTFNKVDKANKSIDKLSDLLDNPDPGVTGMLFLAMGGQYREEKRDGR